MQKLRELVISLALVPTLVVAAECEQIPASAAVNVDELISRSTRIVLVSAAGNASSLAPAETSDSEIRIDLEAELGRATEAKADRSDRAEPALRIARLEVIENLHGSGQDIFYRPSAPASSPQHDYSAHTAETFWENCNEGLVHFDAIGRPVMHFEPGKTYLVFEGPAHVKAAELIESEDDAWLHYVRARLGN